LGTFIVNVIDYVHRDQPKTLVEGVINAKLKRIFGEEEVQQQFRDPAALFRSSE
jgi:hypothetical protein